MTTKPAKQHRARLRMGGTDSTTGNVILLSSSQTHFGNEDAYYLLPATPSAYAAQVEAMANAHYRHYSGKPKATGYTGTCYTVAEQMLAAISIKRPTGAKGDA